MSNKSAPTARQKAELQRRKEMGIARVERPLKLIQAMTNTVEHDANGRLVTMESGDSKWARRYANAGNGRMVNRIARSLL